LVTQYAIASNHTVSVLVRDAAKLHHALGSKCVKLLHATFVGDAAADARVLADACQGQHCVVECLGNAQRPAALAALIAAATAAGCASFLALGGTPALLLPDGFPAGPRMGLQQMADLHLSTLASLRRSALPGWCLVCPSRLFASPTGAATGHFKLSRSGVVDLGVYATNAELSYEDVATALVNLVDVQLRGWHGYQAAFHLAALPHAALEEEWKPKARS
jgi:putative NADH-flavin reductase